MLNHTFHTPRIGVGEILIDGARDLLSGGVQMDRFSDANGNTELVTSTRYLQVTEDRCTKGEKSGAAAHRLPLQEVASRFARA